MASTVNLCSFSSFRGLVTSTVVGVRGRSDMMLSCAICDRELSVRHTLREVLDTHVGVQHHIPSDTHTWQTHTSVKHTRVYLTPHVPVSDTPVPVSNTGYPRGSSRGEGHDVVSGTTHVSDTH